MVDAVKYLGIIALTQLQLNKKADLQVLAQAQAGLQGTLENAKTFVNEAFLTEKEEEAIGTLVTVVEKEMRFLKRGMGTTEGCEKWTKDFGREHGFFSERHVF